MGLVRAEDLKLKTKSSTFLQNFAKLPTLMIKTEGEWPKVQKLLKGFFPITGKNWLFMNIRKQDWTVLQHENLDGSVPFENVAVPKFRRLAENYR